MSTITTTTTGSPPATRGSLPPSHPGRARRANPRRWPLFGVAAGITALASSLLVQSPDVAGEGPLQGVEVLGSLDRGVHHLSFLLGLVSLGCLLVTSTGWKRWADQRAGDDLAARTIPTALAATAAVNTIGVSLAGSLGSHLPGGVDEGALAPEGQLAVLHHLDVGLLLGWWGTVVAALCVTSLALRRSPLLPRWMAVVSVGLVLPPVVLATAASLPGVPGYTMPVWLVVTSVGMMLRGTANQRLSLPR